LGVPQDRSGANWRQLAPKSSPTVRKASLLVTAKVDESLLTKLTNLHVEAEKIGEKNAWRSDFTSDRFPDFKLIKTEDPKLKSRFPAKVKN
jgi:hypothetical protein